MTCGHSTQNSSPTRCSPIRTHDQVRKRQHAHGPEARGALQGRFEINRGELVFLTGHSGAGKSTVLRLVLRWKPAAAAVCWWQASALRGCQNLNWHCIAGKLAPSFRIISCFSIGQSAIIGLASANC